MRRWPATIIKLDNRVVFAPAEIEVSPQPAKREIGKLSR
jgi:hypothetical protein